MFRFLKQLFSFKVKPPNRTSAGFRLLDVKQEAEHMHLAHHGRRDGAREVPAADASSPGTVEAEIIALGHRLLQENQHHYEQEFQSYDARLKALTPQGMLNQARIQTQALISEISALPQQYAGQLVAKRADVADAQRELRLFRSDNGLEEKAAHFPESKILHWGFMVLLIAGESMINATFLARGNELGLLGGWTEALVISLINAIVFAYVLSWGIRRCACHKPIWKLGGGMVALLMLAIGIGFNLFVAHYRNALGGELPELAGITAWKTFTSDPSNLGDFKSVMFFLFGLGFLGLATLDWIRMDEFYPGYGRITRKYNEAQGAYSEFHRWLVQERLQSLRNATNDIIAGHLSKVAEDATEDSKVLGRMAKLNTDLETHGGNIHSSINQLLQIYREANKANRKTAPPAFFNNEWRYERDIKPHPLPTERKMPSMKDFKSELEPLQQELNHSYDTALKSLNEMIE